MNLPVIQVKRGKVLVRSFKAWTYKQSSFYVGTRHVGVRFLGRAVVLKVTR